MDLLSWCCRVAWCGRIQSQHYFQNGMYESQNVWNLCITICYKMSSLLKTTFHEQNYAANIKELVCAFGRWVTSGIRKTFKELYNDATIFRILAQFRIIHRMTKFTILAHNSQNSQFLTHCWEFWKNDSMIGYFREWYIRFRLNIQCIYLQWWIISSLFREDWNLCKFDLLAFYCS